jgi:hypothetical protein
MMPEHRGITRKPDAGAPDALALDAGGRPAPYRAPDVDPVVRRTRDGWRVGDEEVPDLTSAMVLADLLAAEARAADGQHAGQHRADGQEPDALRADAQAGSVPSVGGRRNGRSANERQRSATASEAHRLRATVSQLQYALTARIRIEQAIGVLAERHRIHPRQAFEQLRTAARNRGRKVIDIATDVVASATNPLLQLPDELSRPRSAGRRGVRQPYGAH